MKKRIFFIIQLLLLLALLSGCTLFTPDSKTVNNIIIKEIDGGKVTVEDLQTLLQETVSKVEDTVIAVTFTEGLFVTTRSLGSGVILERTPILKDITKPEDAENINYFKYTLITNRHVVMNDTKLAQNLKVYIGTVDLTLPAKCVYYDKYVDLAVVTFDSTVYLPVATIGDSTTLKKGSFAIALGNPYDFEYYSSATFGIISHPLRYLKDEVYGGSTTQDNSYIQHDVAINSGNSGGGLFDIYGNLIGINTLKIIGQDNDIDNMGFSIPSETVKQILAKYIG